LDRALWRHTPHPQEGEIGFVIYCDPLGQLDPLVAQLIDETTGHVENDRLQALIQILEELREGSTPNRGLGLSSAVQRGKAVVERVSATWVWTAAVTNALKPTNRKHRQPFALRSVEVTAVPLLGALDRPPVAWGHGRCTELLLFPKGHGGFLSGTLRVDADEASSSHIFWRIEDHRAGVE
jgi:hypothetical protein